MEKKRSSLAAGIIGLIVIIAVIGVAGYFVSKPKPATVQGEAEASEYRVSGKVPGRIEELYVREGDYVHKGDTVVFIDSPEVRAKLAQVNALKAAKSQYDMALAGARAEDKAAAAAVVNQAEGALMEVQGYLSELYLTAPCDGIVSAIYPKVGELVGQGAPIMSITDMNDMWFTFNIREDNLHGIKRGDVISLSVPALDGMKLDAKVTYMAARESFATWRATRETGSYDARTFEVRAVPEASAEGLLPGMTVIVK